MKKVILIALCLIAAIQVFAQKDEDEKKTKKSKPLARLDQADRIMVDVFTDIWMNKPDDSICSIKDINRGANAYYMYDIPIGKSNFSFAMGAGISCHNLYCDAWPVKETAVDSSSAFGYVFTGNTIFQKIPSSIGGVETGYKNNKITAVFIDIPLEFRFRTKNEGQKWKFSLGFKAGYLLSSHVKYRGDDITYNYPSYNNDTPDKLWSLNSDQTIKSKFYKVPNIESYRMGPTIRVGWGWVNLSAFYSLTTLFKKTEKSYDMYPISVAITITPF
jgi:hypothetical protein